MSAPMGTERCAEFKPGLNLHWAVLWAEDFSVDFFISFFGLDRSQHKRGGKTFSPFGKQLTQHFKDQEEEDEEAASPQTSAGPISLLYLLVQPAVTKHPTCPVLSPTRTSTCPARGITTSTSPSACSLFKVFAVYFIYLFDLINKIE